MASTDPAFYNFRLLLETAAITIPILSLIFYIGVYKSRVDFLFKELDDIKASIRSLISRVDGVYRLVRPVAAADSPKRLTEYGKEILHGSGFEKIFVEHLELESEAKV